MSLGSGLLLFVVLLCLMLFGSLFVPVQISFHIVHQTEWHVIISIQVLRIEKNIQIPGKMRGRFDAFLQKKIDKRKNANHSVQINWKFMLSFLHKAVQIAARRLSLESLSVNCKIGWDRADYTAYSYGLFWTWVSFLPDKWLKNSEIIYIPDFRHRKREVSIQGIICCRAGQIISILIAWFQLTVQMMLEQNRKEQTQYEN